MLKWVLYSVGSLGMGALITCAVTGAEEVTCGDFLLAFITILSGIATALLFGKGGFIKDGN